MIYYDTDDFLNKILFLSNLHSRVGSTHSPEIKSPMHFQLRHPDIDDFKFSWVL